jgi:hypothetical protein
MKRPNPDFRNVASRQTSLLFDWRADYVGRSPVVLDSFEQAAVFDRASIAYGIDAEGYLYPVANKQWRTVRWYNSTTTRWESLLLIEPARTNGWTYSEDLSQATYTKTNVTISADATQAPDGLTTADRIVETATATVLHSVDRTPATMTDNLAQAFSFYGKQGERNWFWIRTTNKAGTTAISYMNLATGVVGTKAATHTIRFTAMANGWYRVVCILSSAATGATTPKVEIGITTGDAATTYTGSTANGAYLWGFQHEADKGVESSYIQTTSGALARSADILYWTFNDVPKASSLYLDFVELGSLGLGGTLASVGSDAGVTPRLMIYDSTGYKPQHHNGTASVEGGTPSGSLAYGGRCEALATLSATGVVTLTWMPAGSAATAGSASAANALGAAYGAAKLSLNRYNGTTGEGIIALRQLKLAAGVQTLAVMQTLW